MGSFRIFGRRRRGGKPSGAERHFHDEHCDHQASARGEGLHSDRDLSGRQNPLAKDESATRTAFSGGPITNQQNNNGPSVWHYIIFVSFSAALLAGIWFFGREYYFLYYEVKELQGAEYTNARRDVCQYILKDDCDGESGGRRTERHTLQKGAPVLTDLSVLDPWVARAPVAFVLQNKIEALDVNYSILSNSNLNSGNTFLGLFEEGMSKVEGNNRRIEAGVHFLLAGANGDYDARELFRVM